MSIPRGNVVPKPTPKPKAVSYNPVSKTIASSAGGIASVLKGLSNLTFESMTPTKLPASLKALGATGVYPSGGGRNPASPIYGSPPVNYGSAFANAVNMGQGMPNPVEWGTYDTTSPFADQSNKPVTFSGKGGSGFAYQANKAYASQWPGNANNWNDIRRIRDWLDTQALAKTEDESKPYYYGGGGWGGYGGGWGGYGGGYKASPYDFFFNLLNWRI